MIVLAGVFGVIAVVLANLWLAGQRGALAAKGEAPSNTIVVAAVPLKFGDVLSSDKLREIAWPDNAVPAGAFRTTGELLDGDKGGRQALQAIGANEPVLAPKITGPGQRATLSAVLGEGMRAVSIRVNDVLGVAGFVFPGDRVDVLLTRKVNNNDGSEQSFVDVLLQGVKVLAVDQVADESSEDPTVVKAVTVEVDTKDAQKLTLAAGAGQLSLALRQVASAQGEQTERVTLADLIGESPDEAAKRKAEAERLAALEAERRRAEEQFTGIRKDIQNLGDEFDDKLKALQQPQAEPEVKEVVKEVVKYVEPEPPAMASVGVFRGMERQVYEVPRTK